jgi:hypothetical protein
MATLLIMAMCRLIGALKLLKYRLSFHRLLDRVEAVTSNEFQQCLIGKPIPFHFMRADIGISVAET